MSDNAIRQVKGNDVLKAPDATVLIFVLTITFKTCNLPSVLFSASKESAIWSILFHAVLDGILLCFSLYVASKGGIQSKTIPRPLRKIASFLLFFFFLFKLSAFVYESTNSTSGVLFENSLVFPIFAVVLITACFVGSRGFTVIGRVTLIFAWISVFILIFNLFFVGFDGYDFNLYPILRFENVGKGILREAVWFGEPLILMTADLSPKFTKKQNGYVFISYILAIVTLIAFYILIIYTYGDLSVSVNNAFSRVLTMNKYSNELGAVDWPIIILWLISAIIHTACLFASCRQCYIEIVESDKKNNRIKTLIFYLLTITIPVLFYFTIFDNVSYTYILSSNVTGIIALTMSYLLPLLIAISVLISSKKRKEANDQGEENETEQNKND